MNTNELITLEEVRAAQERIAGIAIRTPLIRLNVDDAPAEIFLKLENLQPIGAFKLRGVVNAMKLADKKRLESGVWTVSTGNMARAVAWYARKLGIKCTIAVLPQASEYKINAIKRLGAKIVKISGQEAAAQIFQDRSYNNIKGLFIHPSKDPPIMAGNGTIGLEILEELPNPDAIIIPC